MKLLISVLLFCLTLIITTAQTTFSPQKIIFKGSNDENFEDVIVGDLDGDNDLDVIAVSSVNEQVVWFENLDGAGNFSSPKVITTETEYVRSIVVMDIDNDNDLDVISGSNNKVAWYENTDGKGTFSSQKIISTSVNSLETVYAADIDGDEDVDVLAIGNKLVLFINTDSEGTFDTGTEINSSVALGKGVYASDLDGDNDLDIVTASEQDSTVGWYENIDGTFGSINVISNTANFAFDVKTEDIDGDGDLDVIASLTRDNKVVWYENTDGKGTFGEEKIINESAIWVYKIGANDLDNDGDIDVFSASNDSDEIAWYENIDGKGTFGDANVVTQSTDRVRGVYAGDIDGDGDLDLLSASRTDHEIAWYQNQLLPKADFVADTTSGVSSLEVKFTDQSQGSITSWAWDFGDGNSSTEQNPSNTYATVGTYTVKLTVSGNGGSDIETKTDYITVIDHTNVSEVKLVPDSYQLYQNYPNPFNPSTKIVYSIPRSNYVKIIIYNSLGEEITTLVNEFKDAGTYEINYIFDNLSSGIYFYQMKSGNYSCTKKMILKK